ncbi:MAG TPA: hypothetical protein VFC21_07590 [Bryobacteraceae bacterium]|nr:hypothetical protein [Bryobacteraceae bacterium]
MPLAVAPKKRVAIDVNGETVVFICRTPSAGEMSAFLNSRFITKRNKVESRAYEAREAFMDKVAIDIENATYAGADGVEKPLDASTVLSSDEKTYLAGILGKPVDSWKDVIPMQWKSSAAQRFEDSATAPEEEDGTKN